MANNLHELRYFQEVVSLSEDIDLLWLEKCECVVEKKFRWLEALKIYFNGTEEWIFDFLPTQKQASQYIAGELCPPFLLAKLGRKFGVRGSSEALKNKRFKNA